MKKLIIFDLDGVLVYTKELHFNALNSALKKVDEKYVISYDEHLEIYDGLPTQRKLEILHLRKTLPLDKFKQVNEFKQSETFELIKSQIKENEKLINIFKKLKEDGFLIYVASNSIRKTVELLLINLGLMQYVDNYYSNEDVIRPKPNPEMYFRCLIDSGALPKNTLIIEDSPKGIEAAINSRCNLLIVKNPDDVTYEKIIRKFNCKINTPMQINNLNILIPMAGKGSRFEQAGYTFPKPLIDIKNKPMIQIVIDSLGISAHYIFVVRKEHYDTYNMKQLLSIISPGCDIIIIDDITEGAACTTLLAKDLINNEDSLIIANSDQYIKWNPVDFLYAIQEKHADAGILTFEATHPKWSYAKVNDEGYVKEVAEKKVISKLATAGIYWYSKGSDYVKYAEQMISKNIRVNNEFYVAPVFNEYILDNKKIITYNIEEMWGLGTPEDLQYFLSQNNDINITSRKY